MNKLDNYYEVGTVFDDALPVNVVPYKYVERKKSYYLVNVLPNIINYAIQMLMSFLTPYT